MTPLQSKLRNEANELREAAAQISLGSSTRSILEGVLADRDWEAARARLAAFLEHYPTNNDFLGLATVIVANTTARLYEALAESAGAMGGMVQVNALTEQRDNAARFQHKLRTAASSGNWDEWQKLVTAESERINAAGDPEGDQGAGNVPAP